MFSARLSARGGLSPWIAPARSVHPTQDIEQPSEYIRAVLHAIDTAEKYPEWVCAVSPRAPTPTTVGAHAPIVGAHRAQVDALSGSESEALRLPPTETGTQIIDGVPA